MSTPQSSQNFESFVPLFDTVPETWEDAKPFIVEQLKKLGEGTNSRSIGFYLNQELLSGKQFNASDGSANYRDIFRKTVNCSPLVPGANAFPHGINYDANFTLINLWVSATDSIAITLMYPDVTMDPTNINITSPSAFPRATAFVEYLLEL